MPERITVTEYFAMPETTSPMELVYGVVREPPAPRYGHQSIVTHVGALLDSHVRHTAFGVVSVSPLDVVLDRDRHLVVQPDLVVVAASRLYIIDQQVWGAPDLVVEVLSRRTARRDRGLKLRWYRKYGVRECWMIDPAARTVTIAECEIPEPTAGKARRRRSVRFAGSARLRSAVLPDFTPPAREIFD
jgi:Uma2 family endonuclease